MSEQWLSVIHFAALGFLFSTLSCVQSMKHSTFVGKKLDRICDDHTFYNINTLCYIEDSASTAECEMVVVELTERVRVFFTSKDIHGNKIVVCKKTVDGKLVPVKCISGGAHPDTYYTWDHTTTALIDDRFPEPNRMMNSLEPLCDFRRNPLTLEHFSSVVSAAFLARRAASVNPANPSTRLSDLVTLPSSIERKIDPFMASVTLEMNAWREFHDREVFFDRMDSGSSRAALFFDALIWSTDGTIDGEYTAREMIKLDSLTVEEKYRIACNHCLKNEIVKLKSNLRRRVNMRKVKRHYPLIYYWECVCRERRTVGLIAYMVKRVFKDGCDYPACSLDYFLNRVNFSKRLRLIIDYHHRYRRMRFRSLQNFIMNLNGEEMYGLLRCEWVYEFLSALVRFWMHADFVVEVWIRSHDRLEYYSLAEVVDHVLYLKSPFTSPACISAVLELWNSSPNSWHQKTVVDYIKEGWWNRCTNLTDVRLDVAVLSSISAQYLRRRFLPRHWFDLFKKYPSDCFLQFMNVCCQEEGELQGFKNEIIAMGWEAYFIDGHYYEWMTTMQFSELNRFFSIFLPDPEQIMETKQSLLRLYFIKYTSWMERVGVHFPPSKELVDFIEESFTSARAANEFKIQVLSSVPCLKHYYALAGSELFDWLKDTLWTCSCYHTDFEMYKRRFLILNVEMEGNPEVADVLEDPAWRSFLLWCAKES